MEEKLKQLYEQSKEELQSIGIDILKLDIGEIDICISKRNNKRYGCCKQEKPVKTTKYYEKIGRKKFLRYAKFEKHTIEISKWVLELEDKIIKNTILHEIIHCFPYCNNHGSEFKKYAKFINEKLGYDISRLGNKREDYLKSGVTYNEVVKYKYKIICENCGQTFYRQRVIRNLTQKYRCGKCAGKFVVMTCKD